MKYPSSIQNLIDMFSKLPTVGQKTAERYVFSLLKRDKNELESFAGALASLKEKITICKTCYSLSESETCSICADSKRDKKIICVIADFRDLIKIESTNQFSGVYHVLGGQIDAIKGIKPDQLRIKELLEKIKRENTQEVILALNPDFEGETTSLYLLKLLKQFSNLKITRLAKGLPMGANLEYADELTLTNALKYRNKI